MGSPTHSPFPWGHLEWTIRAPPTRWMDLGGHAGQTFGRLPSILAQSRDPAHTQSPYGPTIQLEKPQGSKNSPSKKVEAITEFLASSKAYVQGLRSNETLSPIPSWEAMRAWVEGQEPCSFMPVNTVRFNPCWTGWRQTHQGGAGGRTRCLEISSSTCRPLSPSFMNTPSLCRRMIRQAMMSSLQLLPSSIALESKSSSVKVRIDSLPPPSAIFPTLRLKQPPLGS